jgi:hypothetical protein
MAKPNWSLSQVLSGLHDDIQQKLDRARKSIAHPVAKGDASELVWIELLNKYLPKRYQAIKGFAVDHEGTFSEQIDVLIFDQQYSPFILNFEKQLVIPAESIYAAFEAKQTVNAAMIKCAHEKVGSVRKLKRTSLPIPSASGIQPARTPQHIIGGILSFESQWKDGLGEPLRNLLIKATKEEALDLGCIAAHGHFYLNDENYWLIKEGKPATAFLFELISRLQQVATVPMLDMSAYARWLK